MTANSALNQNWVGCTVRTPRTQIAHTLRAQCPCRGRCYAHSRLVAHMSRSRACWACTYRDTPRQSAPRSRPHFDVATPRQPESCCDIKSVSRHRFSCPAQARSRHQDQVATFLETNLCRDINFMSRPRFYPQKQTRSRRHLFSGPLHVAISKLGRDLVLEIGSSHSSFCLAQKKKFFFFPNSSSSLPCYS